MMFRKAKNSRNVVTTKLSLQVIEARNLLPMDSTGFSDPFVVVTLNGDAKSKKVTQIIPQNLNPVWNETFLFQSEDAKTDSFELTFWDYDKYLTNDFLGQVTIPIVGATNGPLDEWFPLLDKGAKSLSKSRTERGEVHVIITYGDQITPSRPSSAPQSVFMEPQRVESMVDSFLRNSNSMSDEQRWDIQYSELHLEKELGRGAFGIVYRGKWRFQDVAVKHLLNQKMTEKELAEFKSECQLMMNLRPHKNVVPLLGVCVSPQTPLCIVTEFIEFGSLETLIQSPITIQWYMVFDIAKGITAGIYHLHQENILHRDLAARNILLRSSVKRGHPSFEALIADFGLSKQTQTPGALVEANLRGPFKWMAPEALREGRYSVKSDAFSFGVVLWEIISRQQPYDGMTIYEAAQAVVDYGLRLNIPVNTPPKFRQIMTECWHQDPTARPDFQQIAQMLSEIESEVINY
eukprot:TRINITY_DN8497_c0_g1_i1.p1 TRINITY_DN8497_c0_g1~~TRINITY_DN8497_c0_g1_i1.p1  ORF type:complete len:462 (-),score=77.47 TRINITY_DN8497_c0_g1_i1:4-1389(-)